MIYRVVFYGYMMIFVVLAIILSVVVINSAVSMWWHHKEDKALKRRIATNNLEDLIYNLYGIEMRPHYARHARKAMMRHRINGGSSSYWLPPVSKK